MTFALLLLFVALAAGAAAGYFLHDEAGYALISWGPWTLETSVLGFVCGFALTVLALYWTFRFLIAGLGLPSALRRAIDRRRAEKARASFESGLQHLLEGNWRRAEIDLVRRAADQGNAAISYVLAARAAQRLQAADRRDHYLALALRQGDSAAAITKAELQLESGHLSAARTALRDLHRADPKQPYIVQLLAETLAQTGDWEELRDLLAKTEGLKAVPPDRFRALMGTALRELMQAAERDARLDALKRVWDGAPAALRNDAALRRVYVHGLARLNAHAEAAAQISAALKQAWDGDLVLLYGDLEHGDPVSRLSATEQWLQQFGEQPELLLVAGRACMRHRLWGKARSYLEAAVRLRPSAAAYLELARLCEQSKNADEAARFYKQGLEAAAQPAA